MADDKKKNDGLTERGASRRNFLRTAGIGVAGLAVGGAAVGGVTAGIRSSEADADDLGFTPLPVRSEPGFDHVVVIMFENRSFTTCWAGSTSRGRSPPGRPSTA